MWPSAKNQNRAVKSEVIREFCASSSIHGVRYFDSTNRTSYERFWWMIVFLLSIAGCSTMIFKAYIKWDQNPIIVSFSEKTTPVREVQFPAVTICPTVKVSAEMVNFTAHAMKLYLRGNDLNTSHNPEIVGQWNVVAQVCGSFDATGMSDVTNKKNVVNILKNLSRNQSEVINLCFFGNKACKPNMMETVTDAGLCYSFNLLPEHSMFRKDVLHNEHAYIKHWDTPVNEMELKEEIPYKALGTGKNNNFWISLNINKSDIDYACAFTTPGFTITLHESSAYPTMSKRSFFINSDQEVDIAVKPQIITTLPSAADYHWSKRQCFLASERRLQFFKTYNQENCELECLTNVTLAVCGCVRFSMPRTSQTEECGIDGISCMRYAETVADSAELDDFRLYASSGHSLDYVVDVVSKCNCLPACTSIQYDVEVTQTAIDWKNSYEDESYTKLLKDRLFSGLSIYFKESQFITTQRSELFGIVDFVANCGGLLGLFMGFSILSLLEICYFITIRPFSLRKQANQQPKVEKGNQDNNDLIAVISKID